MHYLVISDIHGNFPALQTVLMDAQPFDAVLCLGDMIGYGPNPNECVERVQEFPLTCIVGNHDWGAIGRADLLIFNNDARQALYWTQHELTTDNRNFLSDLPTTVRIDDLLLAHGSPREPIWEYLVDVRSAKENFVGYDFQVALVGHTHLPLALEWNAGMNQTRILLPDWEAPLSLAGRRLILNPGSVGQPRDGDPRASYAMLDTDQMTWEFRRIPYAVEITQERMRARGLPQRLVDRLQMGR
ncbi:MAG TPA: metallophosphoesterase family protein [Anaerolineae bacterium]|nr:metallophosphoesterase family protein [Anaerolineae bacterium]HQI86879.1 metallophosphoesterase family protein [Anaerolineae bacterium]